MNIIDAVLTRLNNVGWTDTATEKKSGPNCVLEALWWTLRPEAMSTVQADEEFESMYTLEAPELDVLYATLPDDFRREQEESRQFGVKKMYAIFSYNDGRVDAHANRIWAQRYGRGWPLERRSEVDRAEVAAEARKAAWEDIQAWLSRASRYVNSQAAVERVAVHV